MNICRPHRREQRFLWTISLWRFRKMKKIWPGDSSKEKVQTRMRVSSQRPVGHAMTETRSWKQGLGIPSSVPKQLLSMNFLRSPGKPCFPRTTVVWTRADNVSNPGATEHLSLESPAESTTGCVALRARPSSTSEAAEPGSPSLGWRTETGVLLVCACHSNHPAPGHETGNT